MDSQPWNPSLSRGRRLLHSQGWSFINSILFIESCIFTRTVHLNIPFVLISMMWFLFYFYLTALYINLISHLTRISDSFVGPVGVKYRWLCWIHVILNQFFNVLVGGEEDKEKGADFWPLPSTEMIKRDKSWKIWHESMHCHPFPTPNTVLMIKD